mgnify:CR=1 FL=1
MLKPTLWRTCRVLANPKRLLLLYDVANSPSGLTVGEAARRARVSLPVASQYLRALGARGLLAARRSGPRVRYIASANPTVAGAAELLRGITATPASSATIIRAVTAFTHPRRIELVQCLSDDWRPVATLRRQTRISKAALKRHLAKLEHRGLVERDSQRRVRCRRPSDGFLRTLLTLARASVVTPP